MKLAFILDPLDDIKTYKDSSYAMMQEAARRAFSLGCRPAPRDLREMSSAWSPGRSAAARLLWAYYRVKKGGRVVTPV